MIITAKAVTIGLILALTAFTVSTIVLAVQKANLESDLDAAQKKLDAFEEALQNTTPGVQTTHSSSESPSTESSSTTTENTPEVPQEIDYRLPKSVEPTHYDLYLHPNLDSNEFEGQIVIKLKILENTDKIILHSSGLNISSVYFNNYKHSVESYSFDTARDFLIVKSTKELSSGSDMTLGILFSGKQMDTKIVGLYTSAYKKTDGSMKTMFTSKFQPTYARQAFPCFDEPGFKANYTVSLAYPKNGNYHALSNMDIDREEVVGEFKQVYFKRSVPMSSYLVCFLISDFVAKTAEVETNGIGESFDVSVFATPEQQEKVQFALETAKLVTEYYIEYFQVEYPLPKLDMAAIPDFVSGAMEHWGLITYRETALLYDKDYSSTVNKQRVAQVVAHEIAHMWFGNLVTLKWWDDLWLNEGFARFIEYKGQHDAYPQWNMPEQFLVNAIQPVMKFDSTLASHPIVQTVNSPAQITELFDTISYEKGASIIRMLENFIGEEKFETAVTNYLKTYKYNNTVTDDFLTEIEKLGLDIDVKEILRTWTEQRGFPVVNVVETSPTTYVLTQKVFLANKDDHALINESETDFKYRWSIPITYYVNGDEQEVKWFYHDQQELTIEVPSTTQWLKINNKQIGYYRVNYEKEMWVKFASLLNENVGIMSTSDRAHILNDVFSLADANELSYDIAFDMMSYLEKETQYVPWKVAATKLLALKRILMFTEEFKAFKTFAVKAVEGIYKEVKWDEIKDDDVLENRLRMTVLSLACSLGIEECIQEASNRFMKFINENEKPHPDLREVVYYYGMANLGSEELWDKMWTIFKTEEDANEKVKLMDGLSAVQIPWILKRFVNYAFDKSNVREQDYFTCIQGIAANPVGEPIVWDYVRENWEILVERFGIGNRYLGRMIPAITGNFDTQTKLEEVMHFFAKYPVAGAGAASREQATANIKVNIQWLKSNVEDIHSWLSVNHYA